MALRRAGRGTRAAVLKTPQSTPQSSRVFPNLSSLVLSSRVSSKKNTPGRRVTFTPSASPADEYDGAAVRASARRIRRSDAHLYGTSVDIRSRSTVPSTVGSTASEPASEPESTAMFSPMGPTSPTASTPEVRAAAVTIAAAVAHWWPPVARGKKGKQKLPPKVEESPIMSDKGTPLEPRPLDYSIAYTPCKPQSTYKDPHPCDPEDAVAVMCVRVFMLQAYELFARLLAVDKSLEGEEHALKLVESMGGAERGDVAAHAHCNIGARFLTRRTIANTKDLLKLLLVHCVASTTDVFHRIAITPRGTQTQEYNLYYCWKDDQEGDLFHAPSNLRPEAGHWQVGMSDERIAQCRRVYTAFASDMKNKTAYSKGGANRPFRATGQKNKYAIAKSQFLDLGHAFCEAEGFGEPGRRASAVRKIGWLIENSYHYLAYSWVMYVLPHSCVLCLHLQLPALYRLSLCIFARSTYSSRDVNEERIACLEIINTTPFRAGDISLVRMAMMGCYEADIVWSPGSTGRVLYTPAVLLARSDMEDLRLAEMRHYRDTKELPTRTTLRRRFPKRTTSSGTAMAIDFDCLFPASALESSSHVLASLGERKFNILPQLLLSIGGTTACDPSAFFATGMIYLIESEFLLKPLKEIKEAFAASYMQYDWTEWCLQGLETSSVPAEASTETQVRALLRLLETSTHSGFTFHNSGFHGVMSAETFKNAVSDWEIPGQRLTHYAIIATWESASAQPLPTWPLPSHADAAQPAPSTPVPSSTAAPLTPAMRGLDLSGAEAELDAEMEEIRTHLQSELARTEAEVAAASPPISAGTEDDGVARIHHYLVVVRFGKHQVPFGRIGREENTPFDKQCARAQDFNSMAEGQQQDPDAERRWYRDRMNEIDVARQGTNEYDDAAMYDDDGFDGAGTDDDDP